MKIADLEVGYRLPERKHTPSNVSLFLYNAAVWNAHRIHYDERYSTGVERHPGIVIDGPLQGDWLAQCVGNWLGDAGVVERFQYSNRRATYLGETLVSGGRVTAVDAPSNRATIELWVKNAAGEITSPGSATVRLHA
jgi:hydroxyacyl-ACP dehydratase HTD2-like protein with hotdog domain